MKGMTILYISIAILVVGLGLGLGLGLKKDDKSDESEDNYKSWSKSKDIKIVYCVNLRPDVWFDIVTEQLRSLKLLKLYDIAENIYVSVTAKEKNDYDKFKKLINEKYSKIEIINYYKENLYEYPGIKVVYDLAHSVDNDTILLYFHSKGMYNHNPIMRKKLFGTTIKNYKEYIDEFETNNELDIAGCIPSNQGFVYYNFFWVRLSYVKEYVEEPKLIDDRYYYETWLREHIRTSSLIGDQKKKVITYSPYYGYNPKVHPSRIDNL